MVAGFYISSNNKDMDIAAIHAFISNSYWAKGIPLETLTRSIRNSLCFGVFTDAGAQVGFARVVTDSATFGYICDVYLLEDFRGRGLSRWLMEALVAHPDLQGLRRINLATVDAHGLYAKFGFHTVAHPERFMEVWKPDIYTDSGNVPTQ